MVGRAGYVGGSIGQLCSVLYPLLPCLCFLADSLVVGEGLLVRLIARKCCK